MKRLFAVLWTGNNDRVSHWVYFESKAEAKKSRRELNGTITVDGDDGKKHEVENYKRGYYVGLGPDHWRYKS